MRPFRSVTGRAAVLDRADVDTDQIVPKQFLKRIERTGFGEFLFYDWAKESDFELNRPQAEGAKILLTGRNFGCGSSREHAPWALQDWGFEAILAPSFGDIFRNNCVKIGLVPVVLPPDDLAQVRDAVAERNELTVDLEAKEIRHPNGLRLAFEFDDFERHCLMNGLDDVARTLQREPMIAAFEAAHRARFDTTAVA